MSLFDEMYKSFKWRVEMKTKSELMKLYKTPVEPTPEEEKSLKEWFSTVYSPADEKK